MMKNHADDDNESVWDFCVNFVVGLVRAMRNDVR